MIRKPFGSFYFAVLDAKQTHSLAFYLGVSFFLVSSLTVWVGR